MEYFLVSFSVLSGVIDAASNHQPLKIEYHNYKNGGKDMLFIVHPYYVKQYNNRWILLGFENQHKEISILALDRIVSIQVASDVVFIPNTTIDFEHYFDDIVGVSIPEDDIKKEIIVLCFTEARFPHVTSKLIHKSQKW